MDLGWLIAIVILIVVLLIVGSAAVIYYIRARQCAGAKNPWCYKDWMCIKDGVPTVVDSVKTLQSRCQPITAARAAALTAQGCVNVYPVQQSGQASCTPDPTDVLAKDGTPNYCRGVGSCPAYQVGDVEWTAATGCIGAKGFNRV